MSERAYSKELKKIVSGDEAVRLSFEGRINDERAFCCADKKCGIALTCTNWRNIKGKRKYFVPSKRDELHVIGCDEVNQKEEKQQIDIEVRSAVSEVKKNGIITMLLSPDRNTKKPGADGTDVSLPGKDAYTYKNNKRTEETKSEGQRAARIETFIELYYRADVDNREKRVRINGKMYSLDDIFISSEKGLEDGRFGIYYGEAFIKTSFKPEMVEIVFVNSLFPKIYTNKNSLIKIKNGKEVKQFLEKNQTFVAFFRATYNKKRNLFMPFNDRNYKDLCFEIKQ